MVAEEAKKVADERRGDSLDAFVLRVYNDHSPIPMPCTSSLLCCQQRCC